MTKSTWSLWSSVLLSAFVIAATETASQAGTKVRVDFSGSNAQGTGFVGWFEYDQSHPMTTPGVFGFRGSTLAHMIDYQIAAGNNIYASGANCDPFTIITSGNGGHTFQLQATAPSGTTVNISLPTTVALSLTSLPFCMTGGAPTFPNPPHPGSTFSLSGGTTFSGTITAVSCSQPTAQVVTIPSPAPCFASTYTPNICPVYVCQPRRACFLSGLFASRCHRSRCW